MNDNFDILKVQVNGPLSKSGRPLLKTFTYLHFIEPLREVSWVRLQQSQEQRYPVLRVHARSFRVSVKHRSLTWTTESLMFVCYHSYACVYTLGLHTDRESAQHF